MSEIKENFKFKIEVLNNSEKRTAVTIEIDGSLKALFFHLGIFCSQNNHPSILIRSAVEVYEEGVENNLNPSELVDMLQGDELFLVQQEGEKFNVEIRGHDKNVLSLIVYAIFSHKEILNILNDFLKIYDQTVKLSNKDSKPFLINAKIIDKDADSLAVEHSLKGNKGDMLVGLCVCFQNEQVYRCIAAAVQASNLPIMSKMAARSLKGNESFEFKGTGNGCAVSLEGSPVEQMLFFVHVFDKWPTTKEVFELAVDAFRRGEDEVEKDEKELESFSKSMDEIINEYNKANGAN